MFDGWFVNFVVLSEDNSIQSEIRLKDARV